MLAAGGDVLRRRDWGHGRAKRDAGKAGGLRGGDATALATASLHATSVPYKKFARLVETRLAQNNLN